MVKNKRGKSPDGKTLKTFCTPPPRVRSGSDGSGEKVKRKISFGSPTEVAIEAENPAGKAKPSGSKAKAQPMSKEEAKRIYEKLKARPYPIQPAVCWTMDNYIITFIVWRDSGEISMVFVNNDIDGKGSYRLYGFVDFGLLLDTSMSQQTLKGNFLMRPFLVVCIGISITFPQVPKDDAKSEETSEEELEEVPSSSEGPKMKKNKTTGAVTVAKVPSPSILKGGKKEVGRKKEDTTEAGLRVRPEFHRDNIRGWTSQGPRFPTPPNLLRKKELR